MSTAKGRAALAALDEASRKKVDEEAERLLAQLLAQVIGSVWRGGEREWLGRGWSGAA